MNKKVLFLIILFFNLLTIVNAQNDNKIVVKGTIVDAVTQEPVSFANMGILGTAAGVASDMDGHFELSVPEIYATHLLKVSAVGYAPFEIKLYDAKDKGNLKIQLQPVVYSINEFSIFAESLVYKKMLRDAVANISKNYINKPYNYQGYFEYSVSNNGVQGDVKEAIVTIYDNKGYNRSDVASAFKELNYKFNEVRHNHPVNSVFDGMSYFDDIITADIVRNSRNILDISNDEYKLKNKGKLVYEGDSVQVIGYEIAKPTLSASGSASVTKYSGEIYINIKDYAILKNVMNISTKDFNILGRNLVAIGESPKNNVQMTITTNYKKLKSFYFLSGIIMKYSYKEEDNNLKGEMQYVTTKVKATSPEVISGRMYYEDIKANENFWNQYSVYFEGEE